MEYMFVSVNTAGSLLECVGRSSSICLLVCLSVSLCIYIYIYIYREREREGGGERGGERERCILIQLLSACCPSIFFNISVSAVYLFIEFIAHCFAYLAGSSL